MAFRTVHIQSLLLFLILEMHLRFCMATKIVIGLAAAGIASALSIPVISTCRTQSQPNPIAQQYSNQVTGTVNGSVVVLPIPYSVARAAVPSQYPILTKQYQAWLPNLGKDMYPAMLNTLLDHDIQMADVGVKVPDFTRAEIQFPFVDRLNDGYTAMSYGAHILITANPVAIAGSASYGYVVTPATFDPHCDGYKALANGSTSFAAMPDTGGPGISLTMSPLASGDTNPYSLDFIKNITNQPLFSNTPVVCDNFIRFFNTSITRAPFAPTSVKGTVSVAAPYSPVSSTWNQVYGYNLDTAFIEKNLVPCTSLQGYSG